MESTGQVSLQDYKKALTPLQLKGMQLIHVAMGFGILPMLGVVFYLRSTNTGGASPSEVDLVRLLSFVHVAVAVIAYRISGPLFDRILTRHPGSGHRTGSRIGSGTRPDPAMQIVQTMKSAYIVRLALLETVAILGQTICMVGAILGVLYQEPAYWLNTTTSVILIWYTVTRFPTKERIEDLFRKKILHPRR